MIDLIRKRKLFFAIIGGLFVVGCIMTLSRCAPNGIFATPTHTPTFQYLDTPSLITLAFERGEITEEERWLYLAYALYEYKSLHPQYLSNVEWFGDFVARDLYEVVDSPAKLCSMSPHVRSELLRLFKKTNVDTVCN